MNTPERDSEIKSRSSHAEADPDAERRPNGTAVDGPGQPTSETAADSALVAPDATSRVRDVLSALAQQPARDPVTKRFIAVLARLTPNVREFFAIVGRGAGKSRIVAPLACFFASRDYVRAPGEFIYIGVFAPDRKHAGVTFRYVLGLLRSVPALAALIVNETTRDSLELSNGVIIEVIAASVAAPRGRAYALVIVEEAAFLPTDQSANPDVELLRAVRPALARVPDSLLAVVSSPYARRGVLFSAWRKYHDQPDGAVILVQAATLDLNPTFDAQAIATAYEDDPASAAAAYGAEFRIPHQPYRTSH